MTRKSERELEAFMAGDWGHERLLSMVGEHAEDFAITDE